MKRTRNFIWDEIVDANYQSLYNYCTNKSQDKKFKVKNKMWTKYALSLILFDIL